MAVALPYEGGARVSGSVYHMYVHWRRRLENWQKFIL